MQIINSPVAVALGLTIFEPEPSEVRSLGGLPEVLRRVFATLPLRDVGSLLLTSKAWRMLSLAVLQGRYQQVGRFVDLLFIQSCSKGALRVAQHVMQAPVRAQFVLNVAAWCVQKDYPEQIPQYYNLVAKHSPAVLKENRWAGIKAALAEGGNLMPLLLLVVPQVLAIRNERDPSKRNTLLQVEYGYVKSCWARLNPEKKKEKMAHWLKSQSMPTKELFHSLLQTARVLLEVQQELHVSCEDIILFLFDLELDKEKKLDKIAFFEVMIEETANYPHFAEYCINGLLQGQKFETARSILLTCQGMNAQQTASLEDKIDIQEAKALSVESYDLDQKQKKAAQTLLDDEEFFNALDELELSDTEEN